MNSVLTASKKWFACLLFLTTGLLASCSKEQSPSSSTETRWPSTLDWTDHSNFAHPLNPYDSAGWFHNDILRFIVDQSRPNYPDTTQLLSGIIQYIWGGVHPDSVARYSQFMKWTAQNGDSIRNLLSMSIDLQNYFARADNHILNSSLSAQQTIDSLFALETEIYNTTDLTTDEKGWIWGYSAVARYSMAYWSGSDAANWQVDTTITWGKVGRPAGTTKSTVLADAHGYAEGMVEGFLIGLGAGAFWGSIGGPAGTVAGAAGGAVVGSLEGGVAGAVIKSGKEATGWKWPWE